MRGCGIVKKMVNQIVATDSCENKMMRSIRAHGRELKLNMMMVKVIMNNDVDMTKVIVVICCCWRKYVRVGFTKK